MRARTDPRTYESLGKHQLLAGTSHFRDYVTCGSTRIVSICSHLSLFYVLSFTADGDLQALLAALDFVLQSASRFSTEEDHLRAELQQIGLPREHATALAKVHTDHTKDIRQRLIDHSLMGKLVDIRLLI